jgi:hypothetical protein
VNSLHHADEILLFFDVFVETRLVPFVVLEHQLS